jgi:hypothetical protein
MFIGFMVAAPAFNDADRHRHRHHHHHRVPQVRILAGAQIASAKRSCSSTGC